LKIAIVLGTRPEIIKMSPVIKECTSLNLDFIILHSGQHYSYEMDKVFFEQLEIPNANFNLNVGSGFHGKQTGKMITGFERILLKEEPDIVLVQGDTNTVLAGAIAASKLNINVGHIEAGLRSNDRSMPEEINRIITDHSSDILFAPTDYAKKNLLHEAIPENRVFVTGNTVVDAIYQNVHRCRHKFNILNDLGLNPKDYILVTLHRQENVDCKEKLAKIATILQLIKNAFEIDLIYPIHPRTKKCIRKFAIDFSGIRFLDPLDYHNFLHLEHNARLVLTDSGGVQEETCVLKVPCVTLRDNSERPETLLVGSNVLAGTCPEKVIEKIKMMLNASNDWQNPFGNGEASMKIVEILRSRFD
jgi:UDP-N-acetylglucosamine 2-epimerase (non-hydrolysing)